MAGKLTLAVLGEAVSGGAAALRSITRLQPVGGTGDKIFPATYAGGVYAKEKRRVEGVGELVDCVLVNSVQSEANHAELALKEALERGEIEIPCIEVDFASTTKGFLKPIGSLTSLEVPHRLADAILRDSELPDGTRFQKSEHAQAWGKANLWNATPIYDLCPTALLFGMWGSPDKPGGLGAKFERAYVSEMVAVDVTAVEERQGFRIDPLEIVKSVGLQATELGFKLAEKGGERPSEWNHGNIVFNSSNGGIRCRYIEQTTVVSLGALRKLRFPAGESQSRQRDDAGRVVLAALGVCAAVLAGERGTSLRSRCHVWPESGREWEIVGKPGSGAKTYEVSGEEARGVLAEAEAAAEKAGLKWRKERLMLTPTKELLQLVKRSQEVQAAEKGEGQ